MCIFVIVWFYCVCKKKSRICFIICSALKTPLQLFYDDNGTHICLIGTSNRVLFKLNTYLFLIENSRTNSRPSWRKCWPTKTATSLSKSPFPNRRKWATAWVPTLHSSLYCFVCLNIIVFMYCCLWIISQSQHQVQHSQVQANPVQYVAPFQRFPRPARHSGGQVSALWPNHSAGTFQEYYRWVNHINSNCFVIK